MQTGTRIVALDDDGVTFATKNGRTLTLPPAEFLRRWLLHVLSKGFHKIRHYRLSSASRVRLGTLQQARASLSPTLAADASNVQRASPQSRAECLLALTGLDVMRCPRCHAATLMRQPLPLSAAP